MTPHAGPGYHIPASHFLKPKIRKTPRNRNQNQKYFNILDGPFKQHFCGLTNPVTRGLCAPHSLDLQEEEEEEEGEEHYESLVSALTYWCQGGRGCSLPAHLLPGRDILVRWHEVRERERTNLKK